MDLTARGLNGRLDSFAACKLLWSGAVTFAEDGAPQVDGGVVSLHGVTRDEVEGVLPDLLDLMRILDQDQGLRFSVDLPSEQVRAMLPHGGDDHRDLTGSCLFRLQAGRHPLVVELAENGGPDEKGAVRVRYESNLAAGVPGLQDLVCRMVWYLRAFRGDEGPFVVLFVRNRTNGEAGKLPSRVEVPADYVDCASDAANLFQEDAESQHRRIVRVLQTNACATRTLRADAERRLEGYRQRQEKLKEAQPDPNAEPYCVPKSSMGLPSGTKAAKSLVMRSAIYICVGVVVFAAGQRCVVGSERIARDFLTFVNDYASSLLDFVGSVLGMPGLAVSASGAVLPPDGMINALRVVGMILMGLGILWPVRRILKHKRRLDRELSHSKSHVAYMEALVEKRRLAAETSYAQALDSWARNLNETVEGEKLARESVLQLEATEGELCRALGGERTSARDLSADEREARRIADAVEREADEATRHERIEAHCQRVAETIARIERA